MAISKMTEDLNIIRGLSDLPNSEDGLSADDLKKKFDESGLTIQEYLNNTLVPQIDAMHIPFSGTPAIEADTVQSAIENVQTQVKDAASGTIVNGSVTKEKLAEPLLKRTYGGLAWLSMDTPGEADNPETDFPIGQTWLRPAFTVVNAAKSVWDGTGCTAEVNGDTITITGLGQSASVIASQTVSNLGTSGDRIKVLLELAQKDSEITALTTNVSTSGATNGIGKSITTGKNVIDAVLPAGGSFTVRIQATWPSSSLANGKIVVKNFTIVNLDNVCRQNPDVKEIAGWNQYLMDKLPFASYYSERAAFRQVASGKWEQTEYTTLPTTCGGTGLSELEANKYMKTTGGGEISFLTAMEVLGDIGALSIQTGSYVGNGETRTIVLPVEPKILLVYPEDGGNVISGMGVYYPMDNPTILANGATKAEAWRTTSDNSGFSPMVELNGSSLRCSLSSQSTRGSAQLCNRSGVTYRWVAIV